MDPEIRQAYHHAFRAFAGTYLAGPRNCFYAMIILFTALKFLQITGVLP